MTNVPRRKVWLVAAMLPVVLLTSSAAPVKWGIVLTYIVIGFALGLLTRSKRNNSMTFAHSIVLGGSVPILVRSFYGYDLTAMGTVRVAALLATSVGIGSILSDLVRPPHAA